MSLRAGNSGPIFVLSLFDTIVYLLYRTSHAQLPPSWTRIKLNVLLSNDKHWICGLHQWWQKKKKKITLLLCLYRQMKPRCYLKLRNLSVLKSLDNRAQMCMSVPCLPFSPDLLTGYLPLAKNGAVWHAHHPPNCSSVVCRLDTDVCVSASKSVCAGRIWIQSNCCSWKWGQNLIPSSPLTYKTPLMQADPWKCFSGALLHPLSVISSRFVPSAVCTVISPCTDAHQMECWKMKAVTDRREESKNGGAWKSRRPGWVGMVLSVSVSWLGCAATWAVEWVSKWIILENTRCHLKLFSSFTYCHDDDITSIASNSCFMFCSVLFCSCPWGKSTYL